MAGERIAAAVEMIAKLGWQKLSVELAQEPPAILTAASMVSEARDLYRSSRSADAGSLAADLGDVLQVATPVAPRTLGPELEHAVGQRGKEPPVV